MWVQHTYLKLLYQVEPYVTVPTARASWNNRILTDNTMIFNFDTTTLATHPSVADFGGLTGTYRMIVKYTLLNETLISPPYYFTIS